MLRTGRTRANMSVIKHTIPKISATRGRLRRSNLVGLTGSRRLCLDGKVNTTSQDTC